MKKSILLFSVLFITVGITLSKAQQGTLDSTFSGDGKLVLTPSNSHDNANEVVIQADSNIVIGGLTTVSPASSFDICVTRLHPDGSTDSTFGTNGYVIYDYASGFDVLYDIDLQPDQKIVVTGAVSITAAHTEIIVIRLNTDGSYDTTFSNDGIAFIPVGAGENYGREAVIQPDGKILVGGYYKPSGNTNHTVFARLNTDGTLDSTFGTGGIAIPVFTGNSESIYGLTLTPTGAIRAVGYAYISSTTLQGLAVGLNSDGSIDSSFGVSGKLMMGGMDYSYAIQEKNNIYYVCGFKTSGSAPGIISALTDSGVFVSSFGNGGSININLNLAVSYRNLSIQQDGKIIAVGGTSTAQFSSDFIITRLNTTGFPDPTFGTNGNVTVSMTPSSSENLSGVAIQYDGKIVGAGTALITTNNDMAIVRLNASSNTTSVMENDIENSSLIIYPNPAKDLITIDCKNNISVKRISISNSIGQLVFENKTLHQNTTNINLTGYQNGIYFVKVESNDAVYIKKFVVFN